MILSEKTSAILFAGIAAAIIGGLIIVSDPSPLLGQVPEFCGDGVCSINESINTCADDCDLFRAVCGDGVCDITETEWCAQDCGTVEEEGSCTEGEACGEPMQLGCSMVEGQCKDTLVFSMCREGQCAESTLSIPCQSALGCRSEEEQQEEFNRCMSQGNEGIDCRMCLGEACMGNVAEVAMSRCDDVCGQADVSSACTSQSNDICVALCLQDVCVNDVDPFEALFRCEEQCGLHESAPTCASDADCPSADVADACAMTERGCRLSITNYTCNVEHGVCEAIDNSEECDAIYCDAPSVCDGPEDCPVNPPCDEQCPADGGSTRLCPEFYCAEGICQYREAVRMDCRTPMVEQPAIKKEPAPKKIEAPQEFNDCSLGVCPNGKKYARCSKDGHVITYIADPCMFNQASSEDRDPVTEEELNGAAPSLIVDPQPIRLKLQKRPVVAPQEPTWEEVPTIDELLEAAPSEEDSMEYDDEPMVEDEESDVIDQDIVPNIEEPIEEGFFARFMKKVRSLFGW